ncbi:hypothetical protein Scep_023965 [Stephania cephalantha]|uniref:PB1 domain-containing protein n=1 Tax=Stephania cephalantha TaxID=152367 RepID=A0AAP0EYF5_9MAGN
MGKPGLKKKKSPNPSDGGGKNPRAFDEDTTMFIQMAQELKDEGNKLFQKRDHEAAMLKYEKALKLLPRSHIDVAYLRSNMAACYMQMGLGEYPRAINECNLALEVCHKYSKALLKRAKCYEALNRLDLAFRDVSFVLITEPNNLTALEISERVRRALERKGVLVDDNGFSLPPDYVEPVTPYAQQKSVKERTKKKKSGRGVADVKKNEDEKAIVEENSAEQVDVDGSAESKKGIDIKQEVEAKEKVNGTEVEAKEEVNVTEEVEKTFQAVKLAFGEDIRWAQLPANCSIQQLREIVESRFPGLKAFLVKYKDQEGDLITITATEELRWAEASAEPQGSIRLYVVDVNPEQDPFLEAIKNGGKVQRLQTNQSNFPENGSAEQSSETENGSSYLDHWIIEFARVFKNHVGFDSDAYLNLHELGMKLYSEALEDTVTSEEAQGLFDIASEKFQEMAALALFNWGNVHMTKSRKRVYLIEDASSESVLQQIQVAYEWAQKEYMKAEKRYEEALSIKPYFYEAFLALGLQQFEQAKLQWYYAIATKVDIATWPSTEVFKLFNNAEHNLEMGKNIWEGIESQRLNELSKPDKVKTQLQEMGLDGLFSDLSADDAAEQARNISSQIKLLLGTVLYERSIIEFKVGLPLWQESLAAAVEEFEEAGATSTDVAVMIKNHCAHENAVEGSGLGFKIDEIVQAWNEMHDAKRWQRGVPSFRLEPLFRRRVLKLHHILEHM